jgi:tripartite-type tricarboxylate transporter receptor subunit TctC
MRAHRLMAAVALALFTFANTDIHAANVAFPTKTVRFLVGFAPGGGTDTVARLLAQKLSAKWGQPVVVDNRAGADGTIAENIAAQAPPDGHTIIMVINNHTITASQEKLPYDPIKSFTPISLVASSPQVLAVPPSLGVDTLKDFIALAKAKPNVLNFGTSGSATLPYLSMRLLMNLTGTELVDVNYKGSNEAQIALLGGEVQAVFGSITNYVQLAKAGQVKILGVTSRERAAIDPTIPTIAEAGHLDYDVTGWYGVLAPAGTPPEIVEKLHDDIVEAAQSPDIKKTLTGQGFTVVGSSPEEFDSVIRKEIGMWSELMKAQGN